MRTLITSIFISCLCSLLVSFTSVPARNTIVASIVSLHSSLVTIKGAVDNSSSLYTALQLEELGLSKKVFDHAWKGYQHLLERKKIANPGYLTICDFSQSSRQKRLYLIDITNQEVVLNTYVAHGRNSGLEYATKFSNRPESLQSSLGFYVTQQTYIGEHGLSLRIEGLEHGFNDKAYQRAIVVHGADYIGENRLQSSSFMGRSYGCPAVPAKESTTLINTIKNGTCLFIYHPSKNYLLGSKILNA